MIEGLIRPISVYLHQLCFAIALVMKHQKTLAKVRRLLTDRIPAYIPHRTQYSIYGRRHTFTFCPSVRFFTLYTKEHPSQVHFPPGCRCCTFEGRHGDEDVQDERGGLISFEKYVVVTKQASSGTPRNCGWRW